MQTKYQVQNGFTLIEMLITLAIIAIIIALAGPNFKDFFDKGRVKRATIEVQGLIAKAKAETKTRNTDLSISIKPGASDTWCIGYAEAPGCDCTNTTSCVVSVGPTATAVDVTQVILGTEFPDVTLGQNFAAIDATFFGSTIDSVRGAASSAGTVTLTSGNWGLGVAVSAQGRVRICAQASSTNSMGYPACPP